MKAAARIWGVALGFGLCLVPGFAAEGWEKLHCGLMPSEVIQSVGVPLLRQAARGLETWTYDDGGCAQFSSGRLTGWTEPKSRGEPAPRSVVAKVAVVKSTVALAGRAATATK